MVVPVKENLGPRNPGMNGQRVSVTSRVRDGKLNLPKVRLLQITMVLLTSFFVAELTAALGSHSLSLLADAGHVLSDLAALGLTLTATWWSSRQRQQLNGDQPRENVSFYGHCCDLSFQPPHKAETLAAVVNGLSLVAIALWVAVEAIGRLQSPSLEIDGFPMLLTAVAGLSINCINAFCLHSCCHNDLNFKSAFLHVFADVCSSLGVIVAAIAVAWLHWTWADGLISLLVSGAIVLLTLPLLIQSLRLLWGQVPVHPVPQPPCDCDKGDLEKLLFPSLEELIQ